MIQVQSSDYFDRRSPQYNMAGIKENPVSKLTKRTIFIQGLLGFAKAPSNLEFQYSKILTGAHGRIKGKM